MARPGDGAVCLTDRPRPPLSVYMPPDAPVTRSPLDTDMTPHGWNPCAAPPT